MLFMPQRIARARFGEDRRLAIAESLKYGVIDGGTARVSPTELRVKATLGPNSETRAPRGDEPRSDSDFGELWRLYAHRTSDTGLVLCVSVSILSIAIFAIVALFRAHWALRWWPLVVPPVFVGAFGAWGIADRELAERRRDANTRSSAIRALVGLEWASCIAAGLAGAAAIIVFLRVMVGTWIS
jgi:hypothetical protein